MENLTSEQRKSLEPGGSLHSVSVLILEKVNGGLSFDEAREVVSRECDDLKT